jgi:hypothetical protein
MSEALLGIAGELYLPFLVARSAFAKGMKRLAINVWGLPLCAVAVQVPGQMPQFAPREVCSTRRGTSYSATARPGTYGLLDAPDRGIERFQAKWKPVRVKKTRQIKNLEPASIPSKRKRL